MKELFVNKIRNFDKRFCSSAKRKIADAASGFFEDAEAQRTSQNENLFCNSSQATLRSDN